MNATERYNRDTKTVSNGGTMNFCPNCGNKVNREDNFCSNCGAKLEAETIFPQEEADITRIHEIHKPQESEFESPPDIHSDHPMTKPSWITYTEKLVTRIAYIIKYLRTRRKRRLYRQWVEASDLPPDTIPDELAEDTVIETTLRQSKLVLLYVALGVAALILLSGLILLVLRSC